METVEEEIRINTHSSPTRLQRHTLTSTHIRRVAVEKVVSHTKQGLLQLVSQAGDGSELALS